jgi:SNF2 family DNA or RNA helicase
MIDLFPFQREGIDYLREQRAVLLADEMGLGKTYSAIARDQMVRETSWTKSWGASTLVVAPLTIIDDVWRAHFEELTKLRVVVIDPKARERSWADFKEYANGVFCVHWEALRLMPQLAKHPWHHVIADEAHRAKNRKAQQTRALKAIKDVVWKTALSGTPVVNRPDEFWSLLNWLYPDQYRSYWKFFKTYVETTMVRVKGTRYVQQVVGPKNADQLLKEIRPFYVRRLKKNVLKDLPDKYYSKVSVSLTPTQRRAYNQMRDDMIAWIGQQEDEVLPAPVVIAQLTRLQQFACAFAEFDEKGRVRLAEPSSKLDALMELLSESDQQVVVFSRFKQMIRLVQRRLEAADISCVTFVGETTQEDRTLNVEKFQAGEVRVFAGTIAAGGVGITLHAASHVIFTDRDWSPALNLQAEDRLHRIGQKNAVQVTDIMAKNTVDLGKAQRLELKKAWLRTILGDVEKS